MPYLNNQLAFHVEVVLYALDVYYRQMFGEDITFIPEASHSHSKLDYQTVGNNYGNYYATSKLRNAHYNSLPYFDQFHGRYRNFNQEWKNLDKIIEWIETANDV